MVLPSLLERKKISFKEVFIMKHWVKKLSILSSLFLFTVFFVSFNHGGVESDSLQTLEFNRNQLVKQAAIGYIAPPGAGSSPYRIDPEGNIHVAPGTGSITFNFRSGDTAYHIAGDHVEPAVTLYNLGTTNSRSSRASRGLNTLACIGNSVKVITGEAKGAKGYVIGKHGGAEHVMVDFPKEKVLQKMVIGDKMQVYTYGLGLKLKNAQGIKAMNVSPYLMEVLTQAGMGVTESGTLSIPVALKIPAKIMGSGLGASHVYRGDYDIQLFDKKTVEEYNLDEIRFGDIVAIINADHTHGRIFKTGAVSIGVICHSTSYIAGHGPGVTTLFTSPSGNIEVTMDKDANLANLLNIR